MKTNLPRRELQRKSRGRQKLNRRLTRRTRTERRRKTPRRLTRRRSRTRRFRMPQRLWTRATPPGYIVVQILTD